MTDRYDVIVIGAGHNGLTTAALLAREGRSVLVLERRGVVGGLAAGEEFHPGYRSAGVLHDTSCVRRDVVEELGLEGLGLSWTESAVFVPQTDGPGLLLHHDANRAAQEIGAASDRDAGRYAEYRAFLTRIARFVNGFFSETPLDRTFTGPDGGVLDLLKTGLALRRLGRRNMLELLRIMPMSVADWLDEWFEGELLKCLLAAPAIHGTFTGPRSPGSNASLLRLESAGGASVRGGPQSLIDALEAAARAQGVEVRTGAEVRGITVSGGGVTGVSLDGGEQIDAAVVAASCDPRRTFLYLIPGRDITPKLEHRIQSFRMRGTTAKVNLALNAPLRFACRPDLEIEYARTGERMDDLERAFDAVKYGRFSERPILDIYVPTAASPDLAPDGHSVASILVHFVPDDLRDTRQGWTKKQREKLVKTVIDTLEQYAPGTRQSIVARDVLAPPDLEERYGITHGHIHHGEHALDQLLVRPCPECARYRTPIEGLYLCGSGSPPGGGLTCAPGALAASAMRKT